MDKPKMSWGDWLDVSTMRGAITAAIVGGMLVTLLVDGFRYLIA